MSKKPRFRAAAGFGHMRFASFQGWVRMVSRPQRRRMQQRGATLVLALVTLVLAGPVSAVGHSASPSQPFSVALIPLEFISTHGGGGFGPATVRLRLQCQTATTVTLHFRLEQPHAATKSELTYACPGGTHRTVYSDFMYTFHPGGATLNVTATGSGHSVSLSGRVMLKSSPATLARVRNAIRRPNGEATRAALLDEIRWRLANNPLYREGLLRTAARISHTGRSGADFVGLGVELLVPACGTA